MKLLYCIFVFTTSSLIAQENIEVKFESQKLNETRTINVHIPNAYYETDKKYPVIYALDGEYTKYALTGIIDYYSFWDKIPECIIVSINQNYNDTVTEPFKRWEDCSYSWKTGAPKNKGIVFKEFISEELIPFIDSTYRTTDFKTIVGHSFTANFVNYFLLDMEPIFQGYVAISPYYASNILDSLKTKVIEIKKPIFYYTANGEKDLTGHIQSVKEFGHIFSNIENENFIYKNFNMKNNGATHSTIFPIAISNAIEHVFSRYSSISRDEFKTLLKTSDKVGYLKNRYQETEQIYGVQINIRESDINTVSYAISRKKQWEQLKELSELTIVLYPESYSGYWIMGEYEEKMKHYDLALIQFEKGFSKLGEPV